MSQNDEEAVLKSARILYKSGYTDEAKAVLTKLNTEQAKAMLAKMGGAKKTKASKNSTLLWPSIIAGYIVLGLLAFGLGWVLAPKTQETVLLESVNQELQVENNPDSTATIESFQATSESMENSNQTAMTQISASQTAAVQAATATAEAQGQ